MVTQKDISLQKKIINILQDALIAKESIWIHELARRLRISEPLLQYYLKKPYISDMIEIVKVFKGPKNSVHLKIVKLRKDYAK